jgi:hypothetical protein
MMLTDEQCATIEAFRSFIEDSCALDDRYGFASPVEDAARGVFESRFAAEEASWFVVTVMASVPEVRVGYMMADPRHHAELVRAIEEMGETVDSFVGAGLREAGLDESTLTVEQDSPSGGTHRFMTPLALEDLSELDTDRVRDMVVRMLEGYLIAFGPLVEPGDEEDDE